MHAVKLPGPWCRWRLWSWIRPWMGIWHCLWKSVSVIHINIPRHRILRQGSSCQKGVQRFNQIVVRVHALEYLPFLRISHALQNPIVCALYPSTGHYFVWIWQVCATERALGFSILIIQKADNSFFVWSSFLIQETHCKWENVYIVGMLLHGLSELKSIFARCRIIGNLLYYNLPLRISEWTLSPSRDCFSPSSPW